VDVVVTVTAPDPDQGGRAADRAVDVHLCAADDLPAVEVLTALREVAGVGSASRLRVADHDLDESRTVADLGLVAGTTIVATLDLDDTPQPPPVAPCRIRLAVMAGPDAGRVIDLDDGDHVVGRDDSCSLGLNDAAVSRRHLTVEVAESGVPDATVRAPRRRNAALRDLGSANGTSIDGTVVPAGQTVDVPTGAVIRIGDSELTLLHRSDSPAASEGGEVIHRTVRLDQRRPPATITFPPEPVRSEPPRFPVLATMLPLVAGIALSLVVRQWQFLAFSALSPVMMLGQATGDRRTSRRQQRDAARSHAAATHTAERDLAEALDAERERRRADAPDLACLALAARDRREPLWQQALDPDGLRVRLGLGDLPSDVKVVGSPARSSSARVTGVPLCLDLLDQRVVGICGPKTVTAGLLRSLVVQVATLHPPDEVGMVVIAPGGDAEWNWVRWLPHARPHREQCTALLGFDAAQIQARVAEVLEAAAQSGGQRRHTVVVVDDPGGLQQEPAIVAMVGSAGGTHSVLWYAPHVHNLPAGCRSVVRVTSVARPTITLSSHDRSDVAVVPDLASAAVADSAARALAPLRPPAAPGSGLPDSVSWRELARLDLTDGDGRALLRRWAAGPSTAVLLGCGSDGPVVVDLDRDGPHALIAGTTGAGKSELLLALVASLMAANPPDQLALLLVDHKGGATFGRLADAPHTAGVVTDLDGPSTRRALDSLAAEVRRREAVLAGAEPGAASPVLSRLVVVVDEFAALAESHPDSIRELVSIAQRGRSLGIHLVLATQRPEGTVSADIRANTRLRICLGVTREVESRDVIDAPDAASISRGTPGRAYLRIGPGELRLFQAARLGAPSGESGVTVALSPAGCLGDPVPPKPAAPSVDEVSALVAAATVAHRQRGQAVPPRPWLPPLPERLALTDLDRDDDGCSVCWGLVDLPASGRQEPLRLSLARGGTTVVIGSPRSGRTTAVLAIAFAAAARLPPDRLHLWALDGGAGLAGLERLAHCGGIVPAEDTERAARLLDHLAAEVERRRRSGSDDPALLLVIDSWEHLLTGRETAAGSALADRILSLAASGAAAGLRMVIAADRSGLTGRLGSATADKLVLGLADPTDLALIGMSWRDLPRELPAGRGVRAADLALAQVALADPTTVAAGHAWDPPTRPVRRVDPLPNRLSLGSVARLHRGGDGIVIGVGLDGAPVTLERDDLRGAIAVLGRPGTGRSSALLLLGRLRADRPIAFSCPDRSPLAALAAHTDAIRLPHDDQQEAVTRLDALERRCGRPPDLLIDDGDRMGEGPLADRVAIIAGRSVAAGTATVVVAANPDGFATAFNGPVSAVRRARVGLLLGSLAPHDADGLGVRLPDSACRSGVPSGRGWLVRDGQLIRLQLADPVG
jgi:S-DNA-T family DNA segregation ATPase FtsK/SpoIIIE